MTTRTPSAIVDADRLRAFVRGLPGPRSRLHSPESLRAAEDLLLESWRAAGWVATTHPFTLTEVDGIVDHDNYGAHTYPLLSGANLLAVLPGDRPGTVLVGAHLDTVRDSPGAMDNGAAVAVLAELARVLPAAPTRPTVLLAAFDMEEIGVLGSPSLVEEVTARFDLDVAIVLESVGVLRHEPRTQRIPLGFGLFFPRVVAGIRARRRRGDWTAVIFRASAAPTAEALAARLDASGTSRARLLRDPRDYALIGRPLTRWVPQLGHLARSDHSSFWAKGVPALLLTDTANLRSEHYHQASDTWDTIDYQHLARLTEAVRAVVVDGTWRR